jgi:hypothetical protein
MFRSIACSRLWLTLPLLAACGQTSGPVLERVKESAPPDSNLRADVLIARDVRSCAIGEPCRSADPDLCFTLSDASGPRIAFRPETVQFVPPDSPEIDLAEQSGCFRLTIDDPLLASIEDAFAELRQQAFQLSDGEINLTVHVHKLDPLDAGFKRWEGRTGIFLQPDALEEQGLSQISHETDFVFAVTGEADSSSFIPKVEECAGTNWLAKGGFGGSAYTWVSPACVDPTSLLWHFLVQSFLALRDVTDYSGIYQNGYPACGASAADPRLWFPLVTECRIDPDSPTCGDSSCNGSVSRFMSHILSKHWPKGLDLVGNHCRNGKMDTAFDETAIDSGGVCDLIGR